MATHAGKIICQTPRLSKYIKWQAQKYIPKAVKAEFISIIKNKYMQWSAYFANKLFKTTMPYMQCCLGTQSTEATS